jgi:FkbM family methyltransferase
LAERNVRLSVSSVVRRRERRPAGVDVADRSDAVEIAAQRDVADVQNIRRLLAFALSDGSNCIDIGANRGAILAEMSRVSPRGRHIAFEPLPHLCAFLRESFPDVDVHQAALSNHSGEADFAYIHGPSDGWSGLIYRPLPSGEDAEVEHITVRLEVLDQVLAPDYHPALIKIDVEGAEQQVIEGALETLRRHRPIVIFEHGLGSANAYGTEPADIYGLLCEDVGLRIFDLDGQGPYDLEAFERTYHAADRVNFVARI